MDGQTAPAEMLKVIAASPSDVQAVFQASGESACRLFGGCRALVTRPDGDHLHLAAIAGSEDGRDVLQRSYPLPLSSSVLHAQSALNQAVQLCADIETDGSVSSLTAESHLTRGFRSFLF